MGSAIGYKREVAGYPKTAGAAFEIAGCHNTDSNNLQHKSFMALSLL